MAEQNWSEPSHRVLARAVQEPFLGTGHAGTTVRAVAAGADLDPSLVIRHFGTKEGLFHTVATFKDTFAEEFEGPLEGMGERLVRRLVSGDRETPFPAHAVMARASDYEAIRDRLREVVDNLYVIPSASRLRGSQPKLRPQLVAQPRTLDSDERARLYGPALQALIETPPHAAAATGL